MTENQSPSAPEPRRRLPAWLIVLGIGVAFLAGLLALALVPIVQAFADAAYADLTENDKTVLRDLLRRIEARLDHLPETKDVP